MDELLNLHGIIREYIYNNWKQSLNEPRGELNYKFLDPAANHRGQLWDWDSFFCGMSLLNTYENTYEYIQGCVMDFMEQQRCDGSIPYMVNVSDQIMEAEPEKIVIRSKNSELNSIKPLLAQMVMLVREKCSDTCWIRQIYSKLKRYIRHWENTQLFNNGLFVWRSYRGSGTDNHPALYGRPSDSSAGVDLNCLMYSEYTAMSEIAAICCEKGDSADYLHKAQLLSEAINKHMWDPIDKMYYHLDVLSQKPRLARQTIS